tara:strand:+ start:1584 stop:1937 length:354 start_codon:yes stop_codon:yes gene_type:complete
MENSIYYKITGSLTSDFGDEITNPVIKVAQIATDNQLLTDGLLRFEYKVFSSESNLLSGKHFFKAWDTVEDKRLVNFTYPITDVLSWSILTYKDLQAKIIAETFSLNESDVLLIEGV